MLAHLLLYGQKICIKSFRSSRHLLMYLPVMCKVFDALWQVRADVPAEVRWAVAEKVISDVAIVSGVAGWAACGCAVLVQSPQRGLPRVCMRTIPDICASGLVTFGWVMQWGPAWSERRVCLQSQVHKMLTRLCC